MKPIKELLTQQFTEAFEACGYPGRFGEVVASQRPELGQFQCSGALGAAKAVKTAPMIAAGNIVEKLKSQPIFKNLSIAEPGFINITLTDEFLASFVQELVSDDRLGHHSLQNAATTVMDFGGPNIAKPMHVGHLRSAIIGESLKRILRFAGEKVIGDIHMGDWGTQMGMLISELNLRKPDLPYFDEKFKGSYPSEPPATIDDLEEMYPAANARCKSDENAMAGALKATVELQQGRAGYRALWKHFVDVSVKALKADFEGLGVSFDLWYGESNYHDRIPAMIEYLKSKGVAELDEGALVIKLETQPGKKEMPPLILIKSDGGYLYGTTDLATVYERINDFKAGRILYVVDKRQSLHFEQVFQAAKKTGISGKASLEHVAFGTVNGPDGKPFKTRAGGVMKLKDLTAMTITEVLKKMEEAGVARDYGEDERRGIAVKVGIAAVKFADLMNLRTSDYIFDIEKFTSFDGKTGPYHLYAAVRIKSILRKAQEKGVKPGPILPPTEYERELMLNISRFAETVENARRNLAPHFLCELAHDLAQSFSRFYEHCHILNEKDAARQSSWLALSMLCLREFEQILSLLGIELPDRM
ncbi:MAG: arginine--tRNA ligase [Elusimicrobiota bacterium]